LRSYQSVVGVRHIFDDRASQLLAEPQVVTNMAQLAAHDLLFETQISGQDKQAIRLMCSVAEKLPQLSIILSHGCFCPTIERSDWHTNMAQLAQCSNIMIKGSGWEMVDREYQPSDVSTVVKLLIDLFGVKRVLLGSNFPLCLFSRRYSDLWGRDYQQLDIDQQTLNALTFVNAQRVYRFT